MPAVEVLLYTVNNLYHVLSYMTINCFTGSVTPGRFTWSVGTGESVTLNVSYTRSDSILRWRHNGRDIPLANGNTTLTIHNARKADEGVYECFPADYGDFRTKALMLLKVRGMIYVNLSSKCGISYTIKHANKLFKTKCIIKITTTQYTVDVII